MVDYLIDNKKIFILLVKIFISFVFLAAFLNFGKNYQLVLYSFKKVSFYSLLLLSIFSLLVNMVLGVYKFKQILDLCEIRAKYHDIFVSYAADCFFIVFVPLRLSNFLRYLRFKKNMSLTLLSKLYLLENLSLLCAFLLIAFVTFVILSGRFIYLNYLLVFILLLFILLKLLPYFSSKKSSAFWLEFLEIVFSKKYLFVFFITILSALSTVLMFYFINLTLKLAIPFYSFCFYVPFVTILTKIPIFFSGVGIREFSLAYFLDNISKPQIFAMATLFFVIDFLVPAAVGIFFVRKFYDSLTNLVVQRRK